VGIKPNSKHPYTILIPCRNWHSST